MEFRRAELELNDEYFVCFPLVKSDDRPNRLSGILPGDIQDMNLHIVDEIGDSTYALDPNTQFFPVEDGWYKILVPGGTIDKIAGTNHIITITSNGTKNFDTQTLIVYWIPKIVDANIHRVNGYLTLGFDDFKADVSGIGSDVNVVSVSGNSVSSVDDFKADVSGLSTFDHTTDEVLSNVQKVKGTVVSSIDDFKGSFNLDELVDGVTLRYIFELMAAMANGDYDIETVSDVLERVTLFKRNGSTVLSRFEISPDARRRLL